MPTPATRCASTNCPSAKATRCWTYLFDFQLEQRFRYTHTWTENDLLVWDHLGTIHRAIADYGPDEIRLMRRCQVMATKVFDPEFLRPRARTHGGGGVMRWIRFTADGHTAYGSLTGDTVSEISGEPWGDDTQRHRQDAQAGRREAGSAGDPAHLLFRRHQLRRAYPRDGGKARRAAGVSGEGRHRLPRQQRADRA